MPLPDNLLTPIPGENPSGQNLRYDPVYDKLKEARREEEDISAGDWSHEIKKADWKLVEKLATESLANKSKDLQIAAWLTECMLCKEGFAGLQQGLDLLRGMLENFWDTLYPEIEDGDLEMRVGPLDWVGSYLEKTVRQRPLTKGGYDFFKHKESRLVGYEADAAGNEAKTAARQTMIEEGKLTPEEFDADVDITSAEFYQKLAAGIEGSLASLDSLSTVCDEKFGRNGPGFGKLRTALEEVQRVVVQILKKKVPDEEVAAEEEVVEEGATEETAEGGEGAAPRKRRVLSEEPADREDAIRRIAGAAKFWRKEDPYSPVPFLVLRGLRWGELRAGGASPDPTLFEAPPTEVRQNIKKLSLESNWTEVLEHCELAMALPCGRAWLDLQRYVVRACGELGEYYNAIAVGVAAELRGLLADYPQLPDWTLMDDTPTANPETRVWLQSLAAPAAPQADSFSASVPMEAAPAGDGLSERPPDVYEVAQKAVKERRPQEAISLLSSAVAQERNGRGRFHRMLQLASICMNIGNERMAMPLLRDMAAQIDARKLEDWEGREMIAQPLALLYKCLEKLDGSADERQQIYDRLCRLDPVLALSVVR